jgi:ATP/maltotriose-dependent transcriptional regulator MalT
MKNPQFLTQPSPLLTNQKTEENLTNAALKSTHKIKVKPKFLIIEIDPLLEMQLTTLVSNGYAESYTYATLKAIENKHEDFSRRLTLPTNHSIEEKIIQPPKKIKKLSKREKQVIPLLNQGLTNGEISEMLSIRASTVKVMLSRLYKKLNAQNRTEALYIARKNNLL